jgi:formate-dependent nitrite reductase cytochrome c552 subunit
MTGAHQQQQYWYSTGHQRLVSKLPAIYLVAEKRWIPRQAAFLHAPDDAAGTDTGAWNAVCIACHTTNGRPDIDSPFGSKPVQQQVFDSRVAEFGIACESCHGPGDVHSKVNSNPVRRYWLHFTGKPDSTITQPKRLDSEASSQVCGQCHSVWEFYDISGERQANSAGLPYRPGAELRDTRFIAQPTVNMKSPTMKEILADDPTFVSDSFWPDGMIRVSGREYNGLVESPCYKSAKDPQRTMSCFSCHVMHENQDDPRPVKVWADTHQLGRGMEGNEACLQCHPGLRQNLQLHTKHQGASGNLCYNCHMPYTTYGLLRSLRSHQISSPSADDSVATGRPNACNLCHLDKTLAWTASSLAQWYRMPIPKLTSEEQTVSAAVLLSLRGDAGQRALMAWSMGWKPAQEASGVSWMAPLLGQMLDDPYEAVRLIASRSLRGLPGFAEFKYDFTAPPDVRSAAVAEASAIWLRSVLPANRRTDPELLLDSNGSPRADILIQLKRERNDRRMFLRE